MINSILFAAIVCAAPGDGANSPRAPRLRAVIEVPVAVTVRVAEVKPVRTIAKAAAQAKPVRRLAKAAAQIQPVRRTVRAVRERQPVRETLRRVGARLFR